MWYDEIGNGTSNKGGFMVEVIELKELTTKEGKKYWRGSVGRVFLSVFESTNRKTKEVFYTLKCSKRVRGEYLEAFEYELIEFNPNTMTLTCQSCEDEGEQELKQRVESLETEVKILKNLIASILGQ